MSNIPDEWVEKAALVATHVLISHSRALGDAHCACGHPIQVVASGEHERHQARAVVAAVADDIRAQTWGEGYANGHLASREVMAIAWDKGRLAGDPYHRSGNPDEAVNPYRARAEEVDL